MAESRPTPFDLVFAGPAEARFGAVRSAVETAGCHAHDRDAVLMLQPMVELVRDLRPDGGLGEAVDEFVALIHAAFLFWHDGARTVRLGPSALGRILAGGAGGAGGPPAPGAYYVQYPARRIWGSPVPGEPPEPLDGCFVHRDAAGLSVVAVFGLHPAREGFSVVVVEGSRPAALAREDGSALFASLLPGGAAAGLHSLAGMEELLELAWRTDALPELAAPAAGLTELP